MSWPWGKIDASLGVSSVHQQSDDVFAAVFGGPDVGHWAAEPGLRTRRTAYLERPNNRAWEMRGNQRAFRGFSWRHKAARP